MIGWRGGDGKGMAACPLCEAKRSIVENMAWEMFCLARREDNEKRGVK